MNNNFVLLSLGTNLGDRVKNLDKAVDFLLNYELLNNISVSSYYETEPVGFKEQPSFLNAVVAGFSNKTVTDLLHMCKNIEDEMGRKSRLRWHEREIDIDILIYGNESINTENLTVPHPEMHRRKFVLIPAAEIAGDVIHPDFNMSISQLLLNCKDDSGVEVLMPSCFQNKNIL